MTKIRASITKMLQQAITSVLETNGKKKLQPKKVFKEV